MLNINSESVARNLNTRIIGREIIYYPTVTSTNDIAKEKARQNAPEGTVIIAGTQTSGKGRLGRTWTSPEGTLAYSVVLYPSIAQLPYLIMVASLSVVRAVREITGIPAQIKWPNDILINGKKVCGILIENSLRGNKVDYSITGIGINVNLDPTHYSEIVTAATSLSHESGHRIDLLRITRQLLLELDKLYLSLSNSEAIFGEWRDNLVTLGQNVRAVSGTTVYEGLAESVEHDGSLFVRQSDGNLVRVTQGDVTLRQ